MDEQAFLDALAQTTSEYTWKLRGHSLIRTQYEEERKTHCPLSAVATAKNPKRHFSVTNTYAAAEALDMTEELRQEIIIASDCWEKPRPPTVVADWEKALSLRLRMLQVLNLLPSAEKDHT